MARTGRGRGMRGGKQNGQGGALAAIDQPRHRPSISIMDYTATSRFNGTASNGKHGPADGLEVDNLRAERAVLGGMLKDNATIDKVVKVVSAEDFRTDAHQKIFRAIIDLASKGNPADSVSVADWLESRKHIKDVRHDYLGDELSNAAPAPSRAPYYAQIVRKSARKRSLIHRLHRFLDEAQHSGDPPDRLLEYALEDLSAVSQQWKENGNESTHVDEVDAAELAEASSELHLDYLPLLAQDGYVVKGWSHLIAGYPRAGKTELVAACCRDWLAMGETILYLTEEPRSIWQHRLARAKDAWRGMRLVFALGADRLDLLARLNDGTETIVIADTTRGLGIVDGDENDNTRICSQLTPWIAAARKRQKTLLMLQHMRKGGGEHGEGIAGGHAFLGACDIALELRRDSAANRRLVRSYARLIQSSELMYERREDGTMHALGAPDAVSLIEVRRRVGEILEDDWLTTVDVRERLSDPRPGVEQIRRALTQEAEAGNVERDPPISEGRSGGKALRWRRVPNLHLLP